MMGDHTDAGNSLSEQTEQQDERLVRALAEGNPEAEREFALRFLPRVRAMLRARSRNADLTADLVQDVMIESICALRRGKLREPSKLTAFVLAIARNILYSHFNNVSRQPESLEFPDELPDLKSVSDNVEVEDRRILAMEAIAELDPCDRIILHLTLVEGVKPGMIAERLGLSPDVVRQRKVRATRRVAESVANRSQKPLLTHYTTGKKP